MIKTCQSCGAKNRIPAARLKDQAKCGRCKTPISPVDAPVEVGSVRQLDELIAGSPLPVLVDFWATWCGPCHAMAPELVKLARVESGKLVVAKVNTESLPQLAQRFGIQAVPTMILFKDGQIAKRFSGAQPAVTMAAELEL